MFMATSLLKFLPTLSLALGVNGLFALPRDSDTAARVTLVHQFTNGSWLENIGQRRSGEILATEVTAANLWQVNGLTTPGQPIEAQTPVLVASIPSQGSITGIAETSPDIFAVVALTFNTTTTAVIPDSQGVYQVDLTVHPAAVTLLAKFPTAGLLNGMTYLGPSLTYPKGTLLMTDTFLGLIWSLDLQTLEPAIWSRDPLMAVCSGTQLGANGIKYDILGQKVYFSNTECQGGFLASIGVNVTTGQPVGDATIVGGSTSPRVEMDDFDLDLSTNRAFVAAGFVEQIDTVDLDTGALNVVAGMPNSFEVAEPTAVRVGRTAEELRRGIVYVTTAGRVGEETIGAQILAIETRPQEYYKCI